METLGALWTLLTSLDTHLNQVVADHGRLVYWLIWLTLFAETGLVAAVFLPGDTLLFAAAALAARGTLSVWPVLWGGLVATFCGDLACFSIGRYLGRKFLTKDGAGIGPFLASPQRLRLARRFVAHYGLAAVIWARFVPVLRAMAPLGAGYAGMPWGRFVLADALGKVFWVPIFVAGGYFLGSIPWFAAHFPAVALAATAIPILVAVVGRAVWRHPSDPPRF